MLINEFNRKQNYSNAQLNMLSTMPSIAWDFDETLVDADCSPILQQFILDNPQISHYILTARSGAKLVNSIFPTLAKYKNTRLTPANFKKVITADDEKHYLFQVDRYLRKIGKIKGPLTDNEYYEYTIKGKICKDHNIPVLVDDNIPRSEIGCKKYGIKLIDPGECI